MKPPVGITSKDALVDISAADTVHSLQHDPRIQPSMKTDESDAGPLNFSTESPCHRLRQRCTGIGYAILSSSLMILSTFIIKQLHVDFFDTLLCRFIVQTSLLTLFIAYKRYPVLHGSSRLIVIQMLRAAFGSAGLLLLYASYIYIPLPDLTTVRYTQVIWTTILAMIFFRERILILTVCAILLTLAGVVCVAQPTFFFSSYQLSLNRTATSHRRVDLTHSPVHRSLGLSLAFACALSLSCSIVLNKHLLAMKIPHSVLIFQFACLNFVLLFSYHLHNRFVRHAYDERTMFTWHYIMAGSVSLLQLVSSTIAQKAIKSEHPSVISIVQSSDILFAVLLQNLFTEQKSNGLVLVGAVFVTASICLVGIQKLWKDREKSVETIKA